MYCSSTYKDEKKDQDLEFERSQATFSPTELNLILNDNDLSLVKLKNEIKLFIENDPILSKPHEIHFLSREESFKRGMYASSKLKDIRKKYGEIGTHVYFNTLFEETPFMITDIVFASAFKSLASEKQMKEIFPKFENYEWLGSYSQTEMGHGSNVQGIETTATYIHSTGQFELDSPTLTSTKYWIGGLGKLATHTVVFALLLIPKADGEIKNYGPHPFFVQVRSLVDHKPLPGIIVGDIGPKYGFNHIDNGFLRLDKVRISRDDMLTRFFRVNENGEYEKPKHPRLIYAGMVGVRSSVIENAFVCLSRATTIATRYSIIRKQFKSPSPTENGENKILNYSNQMNQIVPTIATTFAYFFTGKRFSAEFNHMITQVKQFQDTTLLAELHSNSSGLKSLMSTDATEGIEKCLISCGGHGYSQFSGLPALLASYSHIKIAEGHSLVLPQQTTRYLLSILGKISTGEFEDGKSTIGNSVEYIKVEFEGSNGDSIAQFLKEKGLNSILHPDSLLQLFKHRSFNLLKNLANSIQEQQAADSSPNMSQIWSDLHIEINHCSKAHCQLYIIQSFYDQILKQTGTASNNVINVLIQLFQTFAIYNLNCNLVDFVQDQYIELSQIDYLKKSLVTLYKQLRPNLLALVDSFDLSNSTLGSALGMYNGNVYETIYKWSSTQPFNLNSKPLGFDEHIKPLINSKL